jgi:hypothetical protein
MSAAAAPPGGGAGRKNAGAIVTSTYAIPRMPISRWVAALNQCPPRVRLALHHWGALSDAHLPWLPSGASVNNRRHDHEISFDAVVGAVRGVWPISLVPNRSSRAGQARTPFWPSTPWHRGPPLHAPATAPQVLRVESWLPQSSGASILQRRAQVAGAEDQLVVGDEPLHCPEGVIKEFLAHYHHARPHQGIELRCPDPVSPILPLPASGRDRPSRPPRRFTPRVLLGRVIELTASCLPHRPASPPSGSIEAGFPGSKAT